MQCFEVAAILYHCGVDKKTINDLRPENCIADLGVDDTVLDSMEFESEQLSNASVYHANFEKIKVSCNQHLP